MYCLRPCLNEQPGEEIRIADGSVAWLIVCHTLEGLSGTEWPVCLWRAEVTEAVRNETLPPGVRIRDDVQYTRARALRLKEQLPAALLFGTHGGAFCRVLDQALHLDAASGALLARELRPGNAPYSDAFNGWLERHQETQRVGYYGRALSVPPEKQAACSPVNYGFRLLCNIVRQSAVRACGDAALEIINDDGETEEYLADPWDGALDALLDAGMALGAPEDVTAAGREALLAPWNRLQAQGAAGPAGKL